jgi:hypothetical protein
MVAPTGVNEETPQEPATAERPGSATAELTLAETVTQDPAVPAGDLTETAHADAVPAAPAAAEAEQEEAEQAKTASAEAAPPEAEHAEAGPAKAAPAKAGPAKAQLTKIKPVEVALAEAASAEAAHADAESKAPAAGTAEAGPAATEAEAGPAGVGVAEAEPPGAEPAGAGEPGPGAGQENRPREESRDIRPLAVVGIIIGVIALVGVAAGVLAMVTHGFKPKTVVTYRPAAVFGLRPGQCVDSGSNSLSYTLVSCVSPHDAEVFARFSLPAAAWPGAAAVLQEAGDGCASRLSGYLNPQLATIGLTQEYVYPNQDAWQADQRTVVCEVSAGSGRLTGSVRAKN